MPALPIEMFIRAQKTIAESRALLARTDMLLNRRLEIVAIQHQTLRELVTTGRMLADNASRLITPPPYSTSGLLP